MKGGERKGCERRTSSGGGGGELVYCAMNSAGVRSANSPTPAIPRRFGSFHDGGRQTAARSAPRLQLGLRSPYAAAPGAAFSATMRCRLAANVARRAVSSAAVAYFRPKSFLNVALWEHVSGNML